MTKNPIILCQNQGEESDNHIFRYSCKAVSIRLKLRVTLYFSEMLTNFLILFQTNRKQKYWQKIFDTIELQTTRSTQNK